MELEKTYLISYPKSGRTWLRLLIAKYLAMSVLDGDDNLENLTLLCQQTGIKSIQLSHAEADLRKPGIRSESESQKYFQGTRVLFVSRNIEDILVSAFYQAKYRLRQYDGEFGDFLRSEVLGASRALKYYQMWSKLYTGCSAFHLVRYEQLHENSQQVLTDALIFLGIAKPCEESVHRAVKFCRFTSLQTLERNGFFSTVPLQARDSSRLETFKFRRGIIGDYLCHFTKDDSQYLTSLLVDTSSDLLTSALQS